MWLGKFLDLKDDIKSLSSEIRDSIKKSKLTPLEFTILESIYNSKDISGYDLIQNLNRHFAGTWKAHSGTIYPILSKLKRNGFLNYKDVKSPIGPLKKLHFITKAGESILKIKVNKNFLDQIKFVENFLIELASIYIHSFSEEEIELDVKERVIEVQKILRNTFDSVINSIPSTVAFKTLCPECKMEIDRNSASYCFYCGASLFPTNEDDNYNK